MNLDELFKLIRDTESCIRRLGIRGDDYRQPHEIRSIALAFEQGKFAEARAFIKRLPSPQTEP